MTQNNVGVHFIVAVWGEVYTHRLITFCLPSLLSPRNLPRMDNTHNVLSIATTENDRKLIEESVVYGALKKVIDVSFVMIDAILNEKECHHAAFRAQPKFQKMTKAHNQAIESTKERDMAYAFIMPDNLFFDGALSYALSLVNEKTRLVYAYGLHVCEEKIAPLLEGYFCPTKEVLEIGTFDLARKAVQSLHHASSCSFVDATPFLPNGNLFFRFDAHLVLKLCYLHPLVVYPKTRGTLIPMDSTFDDGDYLNEIEEEASVYLLDSRDSFMYSLDTQAQKSDLRKYYTSRFNIFEQASRIKGMDRRYVNHLKKEAILYTQEQPFPSEKRGEIEQLTQFLFFLLEHETLLPHTQAIKVACLTQPLAHTVFLQTQEQLLALLEVFFKEACHQSFDVKHYQEAYERIQSFTCKETIPALEVLQNIEYLFDILNNHQKTELFAISLLTKRLHCVEEILKKHAKIFLYGAGEDTQILLSLLASTEKIEAIFDDSDAKVGTMIQGIEVKRPLFVPEESYVIIISSTLFEEVIAQRLRAFEGIKVYTLEFKK